MIQEMISSLFSCLPNYNTYSLELLEPASTNESTEIKQRLESLVAKLDNQQANSIVINDVSIKFTHLSERINLAELWASAKIKGNLKDNLIELLGLQKSINEINRSYPFFDRLSSVSRIALEKVSLLNLQVIGELTPFHHSAVWYALAKDEEIATQPTKDLNDLTGFLSKNDRKIISLRLDDIQVRRPDLIEQEAKKTLLLGSAFSKKKKLETTLGKIRSLSSVELSTISHYLSKNVCAILSDAQFTQLDLSNFSEDQIESLLHAAGDLEEIQQRIRLCSASQLTQIVNKIRQGNLIKKFPIECYNILPLSKLPKLQIAEIFPAYGNNKQTNLERFEAIPCEEVYKSIPNLSEYHLKLCSAKQMQSFPLSELSKSRIMDMFPQYGFGKETNRVRFAALPILEINKSLNNLSDYHFALISDAQVPYIAYNNLDSSKIKAIFLSSEFSKDQSQQRVHLLPVPVVNQILEKLSIEIISLFSDEQIQGLNTGGLSQKQIEALFPSFDLKNFAPGYIHTIEEKQGETYHTFERKTDGYNMFRYTDHEMKSLLIQKREICKYRLALLSSTQIASIHSKLSPEVAHLIN